MVLLILISAPLLTVQANLFRSQDAQVLDSFAQRILAAQKDNLDIQRSLNQSYSFEAYQCISDFDIYLGQFGMEISFISTLVVISSTMESQFDESVTNQYLGIQVRNSLKLLPIARRATNLSAGRCGSSAVVVNRAQLALSLFDAGERLLSGLNRRVMSVKLVEIRE